MITGSTGATGTGATIMMTKRIARVATSAAVCFCSLVMSINGHHHTIGSGFSFEWKIYTYL